MLKCKFWIKNKQCSNSKKSDSEYCQLHHDKYKQHFEKPTDCCVCFENFKDTDNPLTPCGHWIHLDCIYKSGKDECPICRVKLILSEENRKKIVSHPHYSSDPFYDEDHAHTHNNNMFGEMVEFVNQMMNRYNTLNPTSSTSSSSSTLRTTNATMRILPTRRILTRNPTPTLNRVVHLRADSGLAEVMSEILLNVVDMRE